MKPLFSLKWIIATIVVVFATLVMVRLGFWQLDRLKWRQAFNAHYLAEISADPIYLNDGIDENQLLDMEYRQAVVKGKYLFDEEIYLNNQVFNNQPGYFVFTPFLIDGQDKAIFVNRGWLPLDSFTNQEIEWDKQDGIETLQGKIRIDIKEPDFKKNIGQENEQGKIIFWNFINLNRADQQIREDLLPVYLDLTEETQSSQIYPVIVENEIEITQGPHLGYAIQWFFFALLLGGGYPFYVKKQTPDKEHSSGGSDGKG